MADDKQHEYPDRYCNRCGCSMSGKVHMFAGKGEPPEDVVEIVACLDAAFGNVDAMLDGDELNVYFRANSSREAILVLRLKNRKGVWRLLSDGASLPVLALLRRGLGVETR